MTNYVMSPEEMRALHEQTIEMVMQDLVDDFDAAIDNAERPAFAVPMSDDDIPF